MRYYSDPTANYAVSNATKDWKKMAEWITKNSSIIAGPVILSSFAKNRKSNE